MGLDIAIASAVVEIITLIFSSFYVEMFPKSKKRLLAMTIYLVCLPCIYPWEKRTRQKKYCIRRLVKNRNLSQHSATMAIIQHSNLH